MLLHVNYNASTYHIINERWKNHTNGKWQDPLFNDLKRTQNWWQYYYHPVYIDGHVNGYLKYNTTTISNNNYPFQQHWPNTLDAILYVIQFMIFMLCAVYYMHASNISNRLLCGKHRKVQIVITQIKCNQSNTDTRYMNGCVTNQVENNMAHFLNGIREFKCLLDVVNSSSIAECSILNSQTTTKKCSCLVTKVLLAYCIQSSERLQDSKKEFTFCGTK